jgi:predicted nuclease with TOPRIM domain
MTYQLWGATVVIVIGYIMGFYFQRRDTKQIDGRLDRVEGRLDRVEGRLDRIESDLRQFFHELGRHEGEIESLKNRP